MTPCSFFFFFWFLSFFIIIFSLPAGSDRYKRILSTACLVRVRRAKYSMCWINEQEGDVGHGGGSGLCLYKQSCQMSPCPALQGCLHHPDPRGTVNPPAGAASWLMARRESRGGCTWVAPWGLAPASPSFRGDAEPCSAHLPGCAHCPNSPEMLHKGLHLPALPQTSSANIVRFPPLTRS